jgi:hypothetical protein
VHKPESVLGCHRFDAEDRNRGDGGLRQRRDGRAKSGGDGPSVEPDGRRNSGESYRHGGQGNAGDAVNEQRLNQCGMPRLKIEAVELVCSGVWRTGGPHCETGQPCQDVDDGPNAEQAAPSDGGNYAL